MTTCVPAASGVPGLSGPPDWLTANLHKDDLYDPRWRGCAAQGFPLTGGNTEEVSFRALYQTDSATDKRLFLSWNIKVDPQLSNQQDKLYVGLRDPGGAAIVIQVTPYGSSAANIVNQPANAIDTFQRSGSSWSALAEPAWINTTTRVWLTISPSPTWAIQMVVPIKSGGSLTDSTGPTLSDTFGLWYYAQVATNAGYIRYEWKPGTAPTAPGDILAGNYPNPTAWDAFHLSSGPGDAACPTAGVTLQWSDVGTTNTPASQINYSSVNPRPTNTFFARPRNYTGGNIAAGQISGRFRIANWGSIADPNASWVDIPGGASVGSTQVIGPIPAGNDPPATNPISFNWALNNNDIATFITGKSPHKCMFVELTGPGLTFLNNSVYRNMDFVPASIFRRNAEISIAGLVPISAAPRAVYLYVETQNLPETVSAPGKGESATGDQPLRRSAEPTFSGTNAATVGTRDGTSVQQTTLEDELRTVPTYRIHVYHDTGETVMIGGTTQPVLNPQVPFGYFLSHSGALGGWRHQLSAPPEAQLQEISPNFYKIVVPNGGSVSVTTTVQALSPGILGILEGCLAMVLAILAALVGALAKLLQELRDRFKP
jgi:hypothetical protein